MDVSFFSSIPHPFFFSLFSSGSGSECTYRMRWRIQSLVPPEAGSEALKTWVEAGKAVPWEGMEKL